MILFLFFVMMLPVLFCVALPLKLIDLPGLDSRSSTDDSPVSDVAVIACKLMGYYSHFCRYGTVQLNLFLASCNFYVATFVVA